MAELDQLKIPKATRPAAEDIIVITDVICTKLLGAKYADLARQAVTKLARKRPSPVLGGRCGTWPAVVEQIPAKLIPDVVKNTAVKIVHRLPGNRRP